MFRKLTLAALKLGVLALIVLAFLNVAIPSSSQAICRILLVDLSGSVTDTAPTPSPWLMALPVRIRDHHQSMQNQDYFGIVTFAAEPSVLISPQPRLNVFPPAKLTPPQERDTTHFDDAFRLAIGLFPSGMLKELVVLSDGRFSRAVPEEMILLARQHDIRIYTDPLGSKTPRDIRIVDAHAPYDAVPEMPFRITVRILSSFDTDATLQLESDGRVLDTRTVTLTRNRTALLEFTTTLPKDSPRIRFTVRVARPADDFPQNNIFPLAVERQESRARIMILSREPPRSAVTTVLSLSPRFAVQSSKTLDASTLEAMFASEAVILDDYPLLHVSHDLQESIRKYVQEAGGALLVLGGPSSFALGGYKDTPVEKVMPVWAYPDQTLSIAFVLDRSGSMQLSAPGTRHTKLKLAVDAVHSAARLLTPNDSVVLVSFANTAEITHPLTPYRHDQPFRSALDRITAGGSTHIAPAIDAARQLLEHAPTGRKHILLITDGQDNSSAKADSFRKLRETLDQSHISLTVVATGSEIDEPLLKALSNGQYHWEHDLRKLEALLKQDLQQKKELLHASDQSIEITRDRPESTILQGLATLPTIRRCNNTSPQPQAQKILSAGNIPLLVQKRAGRGLATALTTNFYQDWTPAWKEWTHSSQFIHNILDSMVSPHRTGTARLEHRIESRDIRLTYTDPTLKDPPTVDYINPTADVFGTTTLHSRGFGEFEGTIASIQSGIYYVKVRGAASEVSYTHTIPVPYAREYDILGVDVETLARLAAGTGGAMIESPAELRRSSETTARSHPGRPIFLIVAAALFLLELILSTFWKNG